MGPDTAYIEQSKRLYPIWQIKNQNTSLYFLISVSGLMAGFILIHWTRIFLHRYCSHPGVLRSTARRVFRPWQKRHIVGFPGKFFLTLIYLVINVVLTFYDHPENAALTTIFAKRCGWLALCNMCFTVFLALKNTPLSPIAGYSYDTINILHRVCGYMMLGLVVVHTGRAWVGLTEVHLRKEILTLWQQILGIISGFTLLAICISASRPLRNRHYKVFYALHVLLVVVLIVTAGLHRPDITKGALIITLLTGSLFSLDRILRLSRWLYFFHSNSCTLIPLPSSAVKVLMTRSVKAQPGSHVFLWIPGIRFFQRHPFTMVASDPVEFVIKACDGFTRDLYEEACKRPGGEWSASIEGPYGNVPDTRDFEKVMLVAGGSGVTFAFAMALVWARRHPEDSTSTLDFIWTVRNTSTLSWFPDELSELQAHPSVNVDLYISKPPKTPSSEELAIQLLRRRSTLSSRSSVYSTTKESQLDFTPGRPDVANLVKQAVEAQASNDHVLVAGCGPEGLMADVRMAVGVCVNPAAPSIRLYLEQFSV